MAHAPDTDTGSVLALGQSALLWSGKDFRYECALPMEPDPHGVAATFFPGADVIILEGGKDLNLPKIWVLGEGETKPDLPGIFAMYDRYGEGDGADVYGCGETARLSARVADIVRRDLPRVRAYIDDVELPMKDFVRDFVEGGIRGMIGALKGGEEAKRSGKIRVYIGGVGEESAE